MKVLLYVLLFPILVIVGIFATCWAAICLPVQASKATVEIIDKLTSKVDTL
jgi:C4-dicarboxylate transporter